MFTRQQSLYYNYFQALYKLHDHRSNENVFENSTHYLIIYTSMFIEHRSLYSNYFQLSPLQAPAIPATVAANVSKPELFQRWFYTASRIDGSRKAATSRV